MTNLNSNERFVRWQNNLRNQVSTTNNLLLLISIGVLGYFFSLISKDNFSIDCENKIIFRLGIVFLIISILIGTLTNISRTIDFKLTLKKIKKELEKDKNLEELKFWKNTFGKITWFLFYSQIVILFFSLLFLGTSLYNLYSFKF